jgi:hypothetical protein
MKGVVFLGGRKLELREFPDPAPGPRDVVVAMKASGCVGVICIRIARSGTPRRRSGSGARAAPSSAVVCLLVGQAKAAADEAGGACRDDAVGGALDGVGLAEEVLEGEKDVGPLGERA